MGAVPGDGDVEAALHGLIAEMRARYGFRTGLDDAALAAVVRGFYAGASDADFAERPGVSARQVARPRVDLHLFRPADADAPFDLGALRVALSEGRTVAEVAFRLGVSESTAGRYAGVPRRRVDARRSGYYYPGEFESLLGVADDAASPTRRSPTAGRRRTSSTDTGSRRRFSALTGPVQAVAVARCD